ncbi:adenosylcobinamide-GDP ribazoletransferase [Sporanaerobacter acetigenes]|nr:adenosylcobinamide-GDP ribazoletransferase [Sporanaerobacter acetigenes]
MLWHTDEDKMIKGLILSIQFLSRIPINIPIDFNGENLSKSTLFFPLTGMIIGGLAGLVYYLFSYINTDIASFLAITTIIIVTGGLHLDGLGDTFDGFFSARDKDRILEIMKDSRAGTYGVVAIILDILLKYILLSNISKNVPLVLALSCGNGRLIAAVLMSFTKIARPGGIGDMFAKSKPKKYALTGTIIYGLVIFFINPLYLIPLGFSLLGACLITLKTYKTIGGFTGDVYGASIELTEIVSLLVFMGVMLWI